MPVISMGIAPERAASKAADALGQSGDPRLELGHPERYVAIPAGSFLMGAQGRDASQPNYEPTPLYEPTVFDNEGPVCIVTLGAFRIGRYPVTVTEYRRFLDSGGYADPRYWTAGNQKLRQAPDHWEEQLRFPNRPVVGVKFCEALAYCRWAGGSLPSEAEWERAARGMEGRKFPWGHKRPDKTHCNYDNNIGHPTPVGVYPLGATPEAVHDLAGNVWEWTRSLWGTERDRPDFRYPYAASDGREDLVATEDVTRILRGGGFPNNARSVRSAFRFRIYPVNHNWGLGFRVVVRP